MKTVSVAGRFFLLLVIGLACIAALLWGVGRLFSGVQPAGPTLHPLTLISPDGNRTSMQVEWATTPAERETGLMNRTMVPHGMLFIFDTADTLNFWMKNTLVPLDIVFFDDKDMYVSSTHMIPCTADPCQIYPSGSPAKYALEMPSGFLSGMHMTKGWKIVP
jgi:uncharacterized membrane protein (UPF0127 family)